MTMLKILKQQNPETKEYRYQANLYLGGKTGQKLYFGKPIIFDDNNLFPLFTILDTLSFWKGGVGYKKCQKTNSFKNKENKVKDWVQIDKK